MTKLKFNGIIFCFSSPCQRQCELLPSLGVRRLSSINFSHFNLLLWNPLSQMNWNLVGSIYGRSSIKIAHFVPIHLETWPPHAIHVYDCMLSEKNLFFCGKGNNSNLNINISKIQLAINWITDKYVSKTPQPNERKLGRKNLWKALIAHFVPICLQTWPPQATLVSDWLILKTLLFCNRLTKWTETW